MNRFDELRSREVDQSANMLYQGRGGWWTNLVRIVFLIIIGVVVVLWIAGLAPHYNLLQGKCENIKPNFSVSFCASYILGWELLFGIEFLVAATMLCWYKADRFIALLLASTMIAISTIGPGMANALIRVPSTPFLVKEFVYTMGAVASTCTVLLFYLLPDGRFVPPWTRLLSLIWVSINAIWLIKPDLPGSPILTNVWNQYPKTDLVIAIAVYGSGFYAQYSRYNHPGSTQSGLLRWVSLGMLLAFLGAFGYFFSTFLHPSAGLAGSLYVLLRTPLPALLLMGLLICLAIAARRYRLWDLDLIINRTVVYLLLIIVMLATYAIAVGFISLLEPMGLAGEVGFIAAGLTAMIMQATRYRIQRWVNQLMYGEPDAPVTALWQLMHDLRNTKALSDVLPHIVDTVYQTLAVSYVAITLGREKAFIEVTHRGIFTHKSEVFRLPVPGEQDEPIGELIVSPRVRGVTLSDAEEEFLKDLAYQAGVAAQTVRTMDELKRAREQLVIKIQEEQDRIQDEIHASIMSKLLELNFQAKDIGVVMRLDQSVADEKLGQLRTGLRDIMRELRVIIRNGLNSPDLSLGLLDAVRAFAAQLSVPKGTEEEDDDIHSVSITVHASDPLPPLPRRIEVAAYRIIQEALKNVVEHARADTCYVQIDVFSELHLIITDDGVGISQQYQPGRGIASMKKRASALEGTCRVTMGSERGTQVDVRIPLPPRTS